MSNLQEEQLDFLYQGLGKMCVQRLLRETANAEPADAVRCMRRLTYLGV